MPEEDYGSLYEAEVPRGAVTYSACTGMDAGRQSGMQVLIPEGCGSDRIFAYNATIITEGETAYDKVRLHKQFAAVTMSFDAVDGMAVSGLGTEIVGRWQGIDLRDLSPVSGVFRTSPERDGDGNWTFRLPRQGDNSLILNVYSEVALIDSIKIGETIAKTGYDWTAQDLDDIWIGVDWARGEISVRVEEWDEGKVYDIEQ